MIPLAGFLPATDDRVRYGQVQPNMWTDWRNAIAHFLACSFWLADRPHLMDRDEDTRRPPERLLELRNDLGLLAEEYDSAASRQSGNFPQAFVHVALVNAALKVS
jgi:GH15 family glucan-1,4-alpha-glucosidase